MYMIIYILFEYDFKPVGHRLTAPESDTWVMMAIVKPDTIPTAHAFLTKSFETIGFVSSFCSNASCMHTYFYVFLGFYRFWTYIYRIVTNLQQL